MSPKNNRTEYAAFGARAKARRVELGLTQEQVAEQVGVKPNYVGYLERGMRKPSDEICCRIADTLGIERKELFLLANPRVREIIQPDDAPPPSAWDAFSKDLSLHRRQSISPAELKLLEAIRTLGEVQSPRDYLHILSTIRQSLSRG
jgi:transcriptional regulator with XRE-family HTH domain